MAQRAQCSVAAIMMAYAGGLIANGFVAPACTRWTMRDGGFVPGLTGALACIILSDAQQLSIIFIGFALAGAAMALTQYDFAWLCVRLYHPKNARKIVTGVTLFGALASSIMWPIAARLGESFGLSGGWRGIALIMVGVGIPCLWALTRNAQSSIQAAPSPAQLQAVSLPEISATKARMIVFGLVLLSVVGGGVASNLPFVLAKAEVTPAVIGGVLSLFGVGQLCARGLDFLGSGRFGLNVTLVVATCAALISWILMLIPPVPVTTVCAVLLLGAGNGLFTVLRGALPQLLFFGDQFVVTSSALARIGSYARAATPMAIAFMLERSSGIAPTALICAGSIVFGAALIYHSAGAALKNTLAK
jgi:hypothetical protein